MKRLRESKTFLVNLVAILAAAVTGVLGTDLLTPEIAGYTVAGLGMLNIILRIVTNKTIKGV